MIYLFALWESLTPDDIYEYMEESDVLKFRAFQHVRDSLAHKVKGGRADYLNRRKAFEDCLPFGGIEWNKSDDTVQ